MTTTPTLVRLPLTFPDLETYCEFQAELEAVFESEEITDASVLQFGRAATGFEMNPDLPLEPWTPASPAEFAVFSRDALRQAMVADVQPDPAHVWNGKYVRLLSRDRAGPAFYDTSVGRKLDLLAARWSHRMGGGPFLFSLCFEYEPHTEGLFSKGILVVSVPAPAPAPAPAAVPERPVWNAATADRRIQECLDGSRWQLQDVRWTYQIALRHRMLPLHENRESIYAVDAQGELYQFEVGGSIDQDPRPVTDPQERAGTLHEASDAYPELRSLVPERRANAVNCYLCNGSGTPEDWKGRCACWGIGFRV